jgi:hypothetical protein
LTVDSCDSACIDFTHEGENGSRSSIGQSTKKRSGLRSGSIVKRRSCRVSSSVN